MRRKMIVNFVIHSAPQEVILVVLVDEQRFIPSVGAACSDEWPDLHPPLADSTVVNAS